jgi:hypothetical protein
MRLAIQHFSPHKAAGMAILIKIVRRYVRTGLADNVIGQVLERVMETEPMQLGKLRAYYNGGVQLGPMVLQKIQRL